MPERLVHWLRNLVPAQGNPSSLDELVKREFGLRIKNRALYHEALTHASLLDGDETGLKSNERLEFLGDCALDLSVATYLFHTFPEDQEGALTQRKSKIVNRKTLNLLGERMGLPAFIRSKMRRQDIQDTVVGNALEALIGAIYLDHGFKKTSKAVLRMLKRHGADEKVHQTIDFKSKLFHWSQSRRKRLEFRVVNESSTDGESVYVMEVLVDGVAFGEAEGRSKKLAEQAASRIAWKAVFDRGLLDESEEPQEPRNSPPQGRPRGPRGRGSREKAEKQKETKKEVPSEEPSRPSRRAPKRASEPEEVAPMSTKGERSDSKPASKARTRPERKGAERPERTERMERPDRPDRPERAERPERQESSERPEMLDRLEPNATPPQSRRRMRRKPSDS